jgi:hypothetical protein
VGEAVGCSVGVAVGDEVGAAVGEAVGILKQPVAPLPPPVHCPTAQPWHTWYAVLSWYLPDGHW